MEGWNWCGPAVLCYQTDWLIFWTLVIVTRKNRRRRKTRMGEFDFDDFSESDDER
jgi:hypothetical protein